MGNNHHSTTNLWHLRKKNEPPQHFSYDALLFYLDNKFDFPLKTAGQFTDHLNNCAQCWAIWNKVRWDSSVGTYGLNELHEYLGSKFKEYFDSSWAIAYEWLNENPNSDKEISSFYKRNTSYLYNLIIWYESGDRRSFKNDFQKFKAQYHINSVIDYGCGVGNDGLYLLENNFNVFFIDYNCPSIDFLKWRLNKRKLNKNTQVIDVELIKQLPDADMFWAIDVLEHIKNPVEVVNKLSPKTKLFVHHSEFGNDAGGRHPCHFSFDEMNLRKALENIGFHHVPWPTLSVWVKN